MSEEPRMPNPDTVKDPQDGEDTGNAVAEAKNRELNKKKSAQKTQIEPGRRKTGRKQEPAPEVIEVRPVAAPARMKRRHWGLVLTFILMVLAPLGGLIFYLWFIAHEQFASTTAFTVRQEEAAAATDLLGGLSQFAGTSANTDGDILYEFMQSQGLVESIDQKLDLRAHYSKQWSEDWLFSLWPDASIEDLVWFWPRVVRIAYDQSTGLIEVRVLAFDAEYARSLAQEIVFESQRMINQLNAQAREDAMKYAIADADEALARLKRAREALMQFRTRTQIVDPAADIQSRLGVMANLQQQLATALIEYDLLLHTASANDPRVTKAERMIEVIQQRIAIERQTFTGSNTDTGAVGEDYPTLIAEFESLMVDREFAEETYRAALTALDVARAEAARQSRYLATYIQPTLATESKFPARYVLTGLAALFLLLIWSILSLVYYSLRDRR